MLEHGFRACCLSIANRTTKLDCFPLNSTPRNLRINCTSPGHTKGSFSYCLCCQSTNCCIREADDRVNLFVHWNSGEDVLYPPLLVIYDLIVSIWDYKSIKKTLKNCYKLARRTIREILWQLDFLAFAPPICYLYGAIARRFRGVVVESVSEISFF